jgi:hypothetical protein
MEQLIPDLVLYMMFNLDASCAGLQSACYTIDVIQISQMTIFVNFSQIIQSLITGYLFNPRQYLRNFVFMDGGQDLEEGFLDQIFRDRMILHQKVDFLINERIKGTVNDMLNLLIQLIELIE